MKDQLVTFETANLAKEKGFNHMEANCFGDNNAYTNDEHQLIRAHKGNTVIGYTLAPTQSLLQRWIREEKLITIKIDDFYHNGRIRYDYHIGNLGAQDDNPEGIFESYEDALEVALFKALNKEIE